MFAVAAVVSAARAQTPGAAGVPVLRSSTQLVVVDVVVHDKDGHPVRGLKPQNFRLTDGGVAQSLGHVEEHSSQAPAAVAVSYPAEPPGTFTDYTPVPADGTLNILLIDALNMPGKDQGFVRYQLQEYVKRANPKTRIAVFGLANRLILLQGFTSDPAVLRGVVERKLIARSSALLPSEGETVADHQRVNDLSDQPLSAATQSSNGSPSAIDLAANLREFQSELSAMETQLRAQYTLDALNTLAHTLAGLPGRKNLIWFSGSFPLTLLPDPTAERPSEVTGLDQSEFRETVNLFSKAQVAVYPIDARGLMTQGSFSGKAPGSSVHGSEPRRVVAELNKFAQTEAAEHAMMEDLARSTGGHAFYNVNNLADAVSSAIVAGTDYYTLSYTPTNAKQDGAYRPIRVETTGVDTTNALQLDYRRGYYTNEASEHAQPNEKRDALAQSAEEARAAAYQHAAMSRGAPTPQDILFKVRVLPASAATETMVAPDNQLSLAVPANGPFRRFDIDYIALAGELAFAEQPDGHRIAKVEFLVYVYDTEGRVLNLTGKDISLDAGANDAAKLSRGILRCHVEVSVPDRVESFLRIGIRDVATNRFGVIEVPASSLSSLPPARYGAAPAGGRTTPPKD
jgi:VWFA-related protein